MSGALSRWPLPGGHRAPERAAADRAGHSAPAPMPGNPMAAIAPEQLQAMIAAALANGSAVRMNLPPETVAALRSIGLPGDGSAPPAP